MKYLAIVFTLIATPALADEYVHGYERKDGTYVQPYERTSPNNTRTDNYSTQGNTNPYTGQVGHENPNPTYSQQPNPIYVPTPNTQSSYR